MFTAPMFIVIARLEDGSEYYITSVTEYNKYMKAKEAELDYKLRGFWAKSARPLMMHEHVNL